jgi:type I restriction enzyme S subunit
MTLAVGQPTRTGGREATTRHIPPKVALAVGMPTSPAPKQWRWAPLTSLARMESGHTPSRRHPEYWGGDVPWISLADAKIYHGKDIIETIEATNDLGIENSSARVLPQGTVCLSRTASVGYVVVMDKPMATSQDFVNWVCGGELDPHFLKYLFLSEGDDLLRFASGAVHQTIYFPEAKAFHVCLPSPAEQRRIVGVLDEAFAGLETLRANAEKNLQNARALFESQRDSALGGSDGIWQETFVGRETEILPGFAFKSTGYTDSARDIKLLRGDNIVPGGLRWDEVKRWPNNGAGEFSKYALQDGDVVLAMDRTWIKGGIKLAQICDADLPCLLVQRVARLRPTNGLNKRYLYNLIGSKQFCDYVLSIQTGTGVPHISGGQIAAFRFRKPPQDEQLKIVSILDELSREAENLQIVYQRKLDALDELKKSLLHEAFAGKL